MTEALRKYLMPVFAPDDGTGGGDADTIDKPDAAAEAAAAKAAADAAGTDDKGGKTVLDDAGADKDTAPAWGDDWREKMAGGDEGISKAISRYTTPASVAKALAAAQRTISEGKNAKPLERPDGKDEKAMADWRKAAGLPEDAAGYKLPEAVTKALTDADKPVLAQFTEFAHKKGMTSQAVADATEWYVESQRATMEMQTEQDGSHKEAAEDALRKDWGAEYKGNLNLAKRFLDESPIGAMGWAGLRGEDGRMLGSSPEFMNWAAEMGREKFGDAVFASADAASRHDNRRAEIEKIRDTDFSRYESEGLDKEMRTIIEKDLARKAK